MIVTESERVPHQAGCQQSVLGAGKQSMGSTGVSHSQTLAHRTAGSLASSLSNCLPRCCCCCLLVVVCQGDLDRLPAVMRHTAAVLCFLRAGLRSRKLLRFQSWECYRTEPAGSVKPQGFLLGAWSEHEVCNKQQKRSCVELGLAQPQRSTRRRS